MADYIARKILMVNNTFDGLKSDCIHEKMTKLMVSDRNTWNLKLQQISYLIVNCFLLSNIWKKHTDIFLGGKHFRPRPQRVSID